MRTRLLVATALLGLAACSGSNRGYGSSDTTTTPGSKADPGKVAIGGTSLGRVVVDGQGRTIYTYAPDGVDKGKATCTGNCATLWPPVVVSGTPDAGTTGLKVALIARDDGSKQLVVNGRPAYSYSGDSKPADAFGQAIDKVWYALDADGDRIGA